MTEAAAAERLADTVGPIVVKEVRQGLRAKVFALFFSILLMVCLGAALVFFAEATNFARSSQGEEAFGVYLTALGGLCFFVIPFVAFRSMLREVEDETWVLLTLTGLGARSIVRGKWVSAMSQALLFGSACAPFVLFSYFLNGIDLVQIVAALVLSAGWCAALTALGIAVASQGHSKLGRTVAHFVVLGALGLGTLGGIAFAWTLAERGERLTTSDSFRNFNLGVGLFSWALAGLLLEGAAAGLALPSEAASRGPRRAWAAVTLLALAFGLVTFLVEDGTGNDAIGGHVITCFFLALTGPFAVSEQDGWPRQVDGGGWLKPGALRSYGLFLGLVSLVLGFYFVLVLVGSSGDPSSKHLRGLVAAAAYPVLYVSLGAFLGRATPLRQLGEPRASRVGFIVALALGLGLSFMAALVTDGRMSARGPNALNPLMGLVNFVDRSGSELNAPLALLIGVTVMSVFLTLSMLQARDEVRSA